MFMLASSQIVEQAQQDKISFVMKCMMAWLIANYTEVRQRRILGGIVPLIKRLVNLLVQFIERR
ncbi:MAG: hypothetical protein KF893_24340 [Caldilineaceae bacterium]|nr:hypothetical protein [Caldilineaceae bacterium]